MHNNEMKEPPGSDGLGGIFVYQNWHGENYQNWIFSQDQF